MKMLQCGYRALSTIYGGHALHVEEMKMYELPCTLQYVTMYLHCWQPLRLQSYYSLLDAERKVAVGSTPHLQHP
jgi:hypothetical protein